MPVTVLYPKVSLEAASGRIARWLVADGDTVAEGQVLFEIDNDKAAVEVESPGAGVIGGLVGADVEVDVGAEVARIYAAGEAALPAAAAPAARPAPSAAAPAPAVAAAPSSRKGPNPTPLARRLAREGGISLEGIAGSGPRGRVQRRDVLERLTPDGEGLPAVAPVRPEQGAARLHGTWLRRGSGVPLVMLHGFGADLNNWRGMLAGIRGDWPVLALDLPAHGRSPRAVPADLDAIASLVEATLAAEGIGRVVLVGHSFGAALAARIAARGGLDLGGLCLFAPAGLGPEINGAFIDGFTRARSAASLRPWLEQLVHDPAAVSDVFLEAVIEQRRDEALTAAMRRFAGTYFPDGTQAVSIRQDLARLGHLVRVVFGRQDRILPFSATAGLPGNVALHALDDCGHMPHLERTALAAAILEDVRRGA